MLKKTFKWLPEIDERVCSGCGKCVEACLTAGMELIGNVAILSRPHECDSDGLCVPACPEGAIQMRWKQFYGEMKTGKWRMRARFKRE